MSPTDEKVPMGYYMECVSLKWEGPQGYHYPVLTSTARYVPKELPVYEPTCLSQSLYVKDSPDVDFVYMPDQQNTKVEDDEEELKEVRETSRVCNHWLFGYCERGKSCHFEHSLSDISELLEMVFFCGLPSYVSKDDVREWLKGLGFMTNSVDIKQKASWLMVRLESVEEASLLLKSGTMSIHGCSVRVISRQEIARKQLERAEAISKRSVFLGGLNKKITSKMIRASLKLMGVKVVNLMRVKKGYCPKVTLATTEQAKMLITQRKIEIYGSVIDVRPYQSGSSFSIGR